MPEHDTPFEANLGRLLQASVGPAARPAAGPREALRQRLSAEIRRRPAPAEFPRPVLALLSAAALLAAAACLSAHMGILGAASRSTLTAPALLLVANYLSLPLACIIIVVLRRKHV